MESHYLSWEARLRRTAYDLPDVALASCLAPATPYPKPLTNITRGPGRGVGRPNKVLSVCEH